MAGRKNDVTKQAEFDRLARESTGSSNRAALVEELYAEPASPRVLRAQGGGRT